MVSFKSFKLFRLYHIKGKVLNSGDCGYPHCGVKRLTRVSMNCSMNSIEHHRAQKKEKERRHTNIRVHVVGQSLSSYQPKHGLSTVCIHVYTCRQAHVCTCTYIHDTLHFQNGCNGVYNVHCTCF